MTEPITDLAAAVRAQGALPMPVGPGMSDGRLAGIAARVDAATEGPWLPQEDYPHLVLQGPPGVRPADAEGVIQTHLAVNPRADSEFIGHARQDVSDLLAEVLRQRAELAAARQEMRVQAQQMDRLRCEMTGGTR